MRLPFAPQFQITNEGSEAAYFTGIPGHIYRIQSVIISIGPYTSVTGAAPTFSIANTNSAVMTNPAYGQSFTVSFPVPSAGDVLLQEFHFGDTGLTTPEGMWTELNMNPQGSVSTVVNSYVYAVGLITTPEDLV